MKTTKTIKKLCCLILILNFSNLNRLAAQSCLDFSNESSFDLTPHMNESGSAIQKIADFKTYFRLKPNTELNILAAEVNTAALCIPQGAANILYSQITATNAGCGTYLTAVNLLLGMNPTSKKIELFYQPMVLCYSSNEVVGTGASSCTFAKYLAYYSSNFYVYNGSTFQLLTAAQQSIITESFRTYTSSISITHYQGDPNPNYHAANSPGDLTGDVNSAIFTFRELDRVISDNNTDRIKIWNEAADTEKMMDGALRKTRLHSLILSGKDSDGVSNKKQDKYFSAELSGPTGVEGFLAAYANLAHLCPPNCNILSFRITCR